jgi:hypothetical protein
MRGITAGSIDDAAFMGGSRREQVQISLGFPQHQVGSDCS